MTPPQAEAAPQPEPAVEGAHEVPTTPQVVDWAQTHLERHDRELGGLTVAARSQKRARNTAALTFALIGMQCVLGTYYLLTERDRG